MKRLTLWKQKVILEDDIKCRNDYIGGSDIGTIMGVNPWKSAYTLWAEKTGLIETKDISNELAVWFGAKEEDIVAERFTFETGKRTKKSNYAWQCREYPYLRGHVDRMVVNEPGGLECKTTSAYNKTDFESGDIPPMHYWQCMLYMALTGCRYWYLATKRNNNEFHILRIDRDPEAIDAMLDACEDFWDHVQDGTPVEVDGSSSTTETLKEMYAVEASEPYTVDLSAVESELTAILNIKSEIKDLETLKKKYENTVRSLMGDNILGESEKYAITLKADARGVRILRIRERKEEENGR